MPKINFPTFVRFRVSGGDIYDKHITDMDDCQLINEYAQSGSESAFRTLVERHLNLVRSCALRHVNDPSLADEVAQAVFILLARKAHTLKKGVVLPGWLFRTTRFVASRALRTEYRRQQRDQEAFAMQHSTPSDDTWKRIAPLLDDALEHLGNTDRNAILLRFLQDRNHKEVGQALGLSEEAARKRVDRALEKLRGFFVKHGFTLSATMLASALVANAAKASPAPLINSISSAAVVGGSAAATTVLPALVAETLAAWRWAKLKFAGATVASGVIAICLVWLIQQSPTSADTNSQAAVKTADASQTNGTRKQDPFFSPPSANRVAKGKALLFRVVAKDTEEPIANAKLAINSVYNEKWENRFDLSTDANGTCPVPLPNGLGRLDVGVIASGWAARYATWITEPIPGEYTLRLERVTNSIGGWLRDKEGRPVANAEVWIQFDGTGDASWRETPRERIGVFQKVPMAKSDRDGHWTATIIPTQNPGFELEATHPDFATTAIASRHEYIKGGKDVPELWAGTLVTTMNRSLTLTGRVTDETGRPIIGAQLAHQPQSTESLIVKTEADGRFVIPKLKPEKFDFVVTAEGFAPEYREVDAKSGMEPMEVKLQPGALLKLLVVDDHAVPLPGARVVLEQWGARRHVLDWESKTDADGRIEWNSADPRNTLQLCAVKSGWCYNRSVNVVANGQEHTITMERALILSAHVTDADTGEAISAFNAFPGCGEGSGESVWRRGSTKKGVNGDVKITFDETEKPWRVCIEAEGYLPFTSKDLGSEFSGILEVLLKRRRLKDLCVEPSFSPMVNRLLMYKSLSFPSITGRPSNALRCQNGAVEI